MEVLITATITTLLIVLAGISNAIMDTIAHHWSKSIFNCNHLKHPKLFHFFHKEGWRWKYNLWEPSEGRLQWKVLGISFDAPVQFLDAWHFFKMIQLFCLFGAIVIFPINELVDMFPYRWMDLMFYWAALGTIYIQTFNIFYNQILIK